MILFRFADILLPIFPVALIRRPLFPPRSLCRAARDSHREPGTHEPAAAHVHRLGQSKYVFAAKWAVPLPHHSAARRCTPLRWPVVRCRTSLEAIFLVANQFESTISRLRIYERHTPFRIAAFFSTFSPRRVHYFLSKSSFHFVCTTSGNIIFFHPFNYQHYCDAGHERNMS